MSKDNHTPLRVRGTISVNPRGFGFLNIERLASDDTSGDLPESAFIAPPILNGLLDGDIVTATVTSSAPDCYEARDVSLELRWRGRLFGEVTRHRGKIHLHLDPEISNTDWPLDGAGDLKPGTPVVGRIDGERLKFVREVPAAEVGIEHIISRHGLATEFEPWQVNPPELRGRRDLTDIPTITIDAPHSRDLDDAVAVLPAGPHGAVRLLVSIADVDAWVPEDSRLDRQARRRGTSVYLAGRVLPMLPRELSEDAISLQPGERRATVTAELRIDPEGVVTSVDLYESVIVSDARLSYDDVARFLEDNDPAPIPAPLRSTLAWLRTAGARLSTVRRARGGVELLREEARVTLSEEDEPTELTARTLNTAHMLIERLMVATNEAVALWLRDRGLPGLYRVHPAPTPDRVEALADAIKHFGFEAGIGDTLSPRALAALEAQFAATPLAPAMRAVVGQALGPARYQPQPAPHFGLAAPLYAHFTSPIRRYADLTVHRIIKRHLAGDREQHPGDPELDAIAEQINEQQQVATQAERDRLRMLAARHFAGRIGERFTGHVILTRHFGMMVHLDGVGVAGTVAIGSLPGGPWEVAEHRHALESDDRTFHVGQRVEVEVAGVDETLGRIELELVEG